MNVLYVRIHMTFSVGHINNSYSLVVASHPKGEKERGDNYLYLPMSVISYRSARGHCKMNQLDH